MTFSSDDSSDEDKSPKKVAPQVNGKLPTGTKKQDSSSDSESSEDEKPAQVCFHYYYHTYK